ncbi:MAG: AAA family ATPase [Pirellulales bacterium]
MFYTVDFDRMPEAFLRAVTMSESRPASPRRAPPDRPIDLACCVAISREVGALGTTVAREVGSRLGWPVYDHEILEQIAQRMRVPVSLLEQVDERHVSWLEECLDAFTAVPLVRESTYVRQLVELLGALGKQGQAVIVGRGAAHYLPCQTTLRVRLVAPLEDRIATMQREMQLSPDSAARFVHEADRQRRRFIYDHFLKDCEDHQHYDLLLNTSRCSVQSCATVIVDALHSMQQQK